MCFGDSNTQGCNLDGPWYGWNERWSSRLQYLLGFAEYRIIEEGLGSRETIFVDPFNPLTQGIEGLNMALGTQYPLDMIILSLGLNDSKKTFNVNAKGIVEGYEILINQIRSHSILHHYPFPQIFILSPPLLGNPRLFSCPAYDSDSNKKVEELIPLLKQYADNHHYLFFPISSVATVGSDQYHLTAEGHQAVASAIAPLIKEALQCKEVKIPRR